MAGSAKFWDKNAVKYAASPVRDEAAYAATLDRVREHLPADARVLEVGCGTGTTALKLAGDVAHLTASDISAKMIEIAEGKRQEAGAENVRFVQATLDDHGFETGAYDAVLAFNFLHLVDDAPAALAEIHRLVKPGGLFISKTICLKEWNMFLPLMIRAMRLVGKAPYVNMLKTEDIDGMITAAGFEIVETGYYPKKARNRFVVARNEA